MAKKLSLTGILLACAFILSYIEYLFPFSLGIPGMKLGLSNLVIVIAFYLLPVRYVAMLDIGKVLLTAFLFTNMSAFMYSMAGAALSFLIMFLLKHSNRFSPIGVSAMGGIFHNIGQLFIAAMIVETFSIVYYLPILLVCGLLTGILLGFIADRVMHYLHWSV